MREVLEIKCCDEEGAISTEKGSKDKVGLEAAKETQKGRRHFSLIGKSS